MPRLFLRVLAVLAALAFTAAPAFAAEKGGASEVQFLIQVMLLLVAGRVLGEIMHRVGQPAVMGQLLAGVLLGPSVFGLLAPEWQHTLFPPRPEQKAMLDAVSSLGILMLLLLTGMETNLELVSRVRRTALSVSVSGIVIPFACGFALGEMLPQSMLPNPELRLITSLFLGTSLSISSVKIVAMVVREMNFSRRNVGQLIVASAIIDDTIGWVIIAVTFSLALHGHVDFWAVGQTLLGTAIFLALAFSIGQRLVFQLIRWANDTLTTEGAVISIILTITAALALVTQFIGVHTVLGAFVAGILVGQSPILTRRIEDQLRGLIVALFAPVFFGLAGLGADLTILKDPWMIALTAGLVLIASFGKFAGAFIGGRLGKISRAESLALACGMNARGSTEVIVATIGLSIGALSESLYTMIVAMAVITTMAMPPMLRWALKRLPMSEEERERLAREDFEAQGFIANLERLLTAADESPSGQVAARIAGLLAAPRGMPVTVLELTPQNGDNQPAMAPGEVTQRAADVAEAKAPDITAKRPEAEPGQAVQTEASKGYDLLILGLEPALTETGGFQRRLVRVTDRFDGPIAIVLARGRLAASPTARLDILAPITGTEVSGRGSEFALALARATGVRVSAVHVPLGKQTAARRAGLGRLARADRAITRGMRRLAEHYGVEVTTKIAKRGGEPEETILDEAQGRLIIMGVARRPGDTLAFGHVAEAILAKPDQPVIFVMS